MTTVGFVSCIGSGHVTRCTGDHRQFVRTACGRASATDRWLNLAVPDSPPIARYPQVLWTTALRLWTLIETVVHSLGMDLGTRA